MSSIALIEVMNDNGNWLKIAECSNNPQRVAQMLQSQFLNSSNYKKLRAIDSVTKQLIDMAFR